MRKPILWVAGFGLLATIAGCDRGDSTVSATNIAPPVRAASLVEAEYPQFRNVSEYRSETAHVTAENQVEVLAKGTGHCLSVRVEEGDEVASGDVLAELDKDEMEAQVRQSRVNVSQQRVAFERADKGLAQGIISKADRDNAKFSFEQAQATLDMQEVQLSFLTIRAPISGIVTKRLLQEGMLVSSGMPVFNIVDPSSYILPILVVEGDLPRLRVGQKAHVTIDSSGDREFEARVRRINPNVDLEKGSVKVILEFDQKDHSYLRESAFARYSLVMDTHENALVVPKDAIVEENARQFVMVVEKAPEASETSPAPAPEATEVDSENAPDTETGPATEQEVPAAEAAAGPALVAQRVEVQTGLEDSDYIEVLTGIDADTLVITLGQQTVSDGDEVEVGNLEETLASRNDLSADELLDKAKNDRKANDGRSEPSDTKADRR